MMKGSIRFWSRTCLECIGISILAAIVLIVFVAAGKEALDDAWLSVISVFPYYLLISGMFLLVMTLVSYFQIYFSLLISMGATRKMVIGGILISTACMILGIVAIMGIIWYFVPGDVAEDGKKLLPAITAGLFLIGALVILAATLILKWGRKGIFITFLLAGLAAAGIMMVQIQSNTTLFYGLHYMERHPVTILGAGILIYLAAGGFAAIANRQFEVRM